jgi:hypothetical protein
MSNLSRSLGMGFREGLLKAAAGRSKPAVYGSPCRATRKFTLQTLAKRSNFGHWGEPHDQQECSERYTKPKIRS